MPPQLQQPADATPPPAALQSLFYEPLPLPLSLPIAGEVACIALPIMKIAKLFINPGQLRLPVGWVERGLATGRGAL